MLAPVTLGMVGLLFALWANGLQLLGVDSEPADSDTSPTASAGAVGIAGSAMGALTLLFMAIWLVTAAPLGDEGVSAQVGLLFSAIAGMYGLLWLGAAVVQIRNWDMRVIGNLALLCLILQLVHMALLANYRADAGISTAHFILTEAVLLSYVLVLYGFWGATHGRLQPKVTGWLCMLASLGTLYILVWGGGLLAPPG